MNVNFKDHKKICAVEYKECPCRIYVKCNWYCNFFKLFASLSYNKMRIKAKDLLERVCADVKNNVNFHEYIAKASKSLTQKFLKQVEIGDLVYCTTEMDDVIFLKKPSTKYRKCLFQTLDSKIKEQWAFCFRCISKGNKYFDFKVLDSKEGKLLGLFAREYGFRVKVINLKKYSIVRIFGDSQEQVDNFAISYLVNENVI